MLKQRDLTKQQPQQAGQQLSVSIAKLSSLDPGNKRLDLCGVSGFLIWIFLHRRRRRFYAARRSEARANGHFLPFSSPAAASTRSTDTLTGTVTDETGAIVADANVKVTYPAKQLERQVTTDSDGHFILPHLPPNRYKWTTLTFEVR